MKTYFTLALVAACLYSLPSLAQRHGWERDRYRRGYMAYGGYHRPYYNNYYRPYYSRPSVSIIASVPFGAVVLHLGGHPYHYYNGTFYRPYGYGFSIVTPPVGIIVPMLPPGCVSVMIGGRPCYYYSGTYYMPLADNGYQVIEPPTASNNNNDDAVANNNGANDNTEYEKVVIDGKTYYKRGNTYYKANVDENGTVTYEAVGGSGK